MVARLRLAWAIACVALHLVLGGLLIALVFPFLKALGRQSVVRWWSIRLLAICRMRVRVVGPRGVAVYNPTPDRSWSADTIEAATRLDGIGAMLVLNHISWADIFVAHSLRPVRFIAKSEIAGWPLIGYLTGRTGTFFIERGRRHAVREMNHRLAESLKGGDLVGMFPEGTTGEGDRLLPFHANLLQPAIHVQAPIMVGGIRYLDARGRATTAAAYVGETNLFQSLTRILAAGPLLAELHLIAAIDTAEGATRHVIAQRARELIAQRLGFDDEDGEIAADLASVLVGAQASIRRGPATADTAPGTAFDPRDELL